MCGGHLQWCSAVVVAGRGEGHISAVSAVAFSQRSAAFVVSGGADKLLKVWDLAAALAPPAAAAPAAKSAKQRKKRQGAEQEAAVLAAEPAANGRAAGAFWSRHRGPSALMGPIVMKFMCRAACP